MIDGLKSDLITSVAGKQDKLVAGNGIQISNDGVISTTVPTSQTIDSPTSVGSLSNFTTSGEKTTKSATKLNFSKGTISVNNYSISYTRTTQSSVALYKANASFSMAILRPNFIPINSKGSLTIACLDTNGYVIKEGTINFNSGSESIGYFTCLNSGEYASRDSSITAYLLSANWSIQ